MHEIDRRADGGELFHELRVDLDGAVQVAVDPAQRRNDALRARRRLEGDLEVVRRFAGDGFRLVDHLFGEAGQLLDTFIDGDSGIFRLRLGPVRVPATRLRAQAHGVGDGLTDSAPERVPACDGCCFDHGFGLRRFDRFAHGRRCLLPQPVALGLAGAVQGVSRPRISPWLEWKSYSGSWCATIALSTPADLYRTHRAITFAAMQH